VKLYLSLGIAGAVVVGGIFSFLYASHHWKPPSPHAGMFGDPQYQVAWDEFADLVHPVLEGTLANGVAPEWEKWNGKCDAGLKGDCANNGKTRRNKFGAAAGAAEIPRQVLAEFGEAEKRNRQNPIVEQYAQAPELGSVLFDPSATASIQSANLGDAKSLNAIISQLNGVSGADRHLPEGTFIAGSEAIKLIWEIIPVSKPVYVYDPDNIQDEGGKLFPVAGWKTKYLINPNTKLGCDPVLPGDNSTGKTETVSINCFYWFQISANDPCDELRPEVSMAWCQLGMKNEVFNVVLVGFHVMKLLPEYHDWIWMTYYWDRKTNEAENTGAVKWKAPWNRYHVETTTAIRENATGDHQTCFSPYLEGTKENGTKANCLSCHSFSAYEPNVSKVEDGSAYGQKYPYDLQLRAQDEKTFFAASVQTGFVWSISTTQDSHTSELLKKFEQVLEGDLLTQVMGP
jgi:hypothetical protein